MSRLADQLKNRLTQKDIIIAPGIYDTLGGVAAEQAGIEAVFFSGSAVAFSQLGRPDIGLVTLTEMADSVARVCDRVDIPVLIDGESGFGNAAHVSRSVRVLERAGVSAIQIEDQVPIKPPNALQSRPLVSIEEMQGKLKAALDARDSTLISARSDAAMSSTVDEAIDRALAYQSVGVDLIFVEGLTKVADVTRLVSALGPKTPLIYNLLRTDSELQDAKQLESLGFSIALFPGAVIQPASHAILQAMNDLKNRPSLQAMSEGRLSGPELQSLLQSRSFIEKIEAI